MKVTSQTIEPVSQRLVELSPIEILRLINEIYGDRAAILTSMQLSGTVLCHMADRAGLAMDVVFVDTGVLHAETLATRDRLSATHPKLRVITVKPEQSFTQQTQEHGLLYLSKEGQERCCDLRKSAPLHALAGKYDVLLAGLRRDEGGKRARIGAVELDPALGALRVHPLASFTRDDLDKYLSANPDVVVNPLHAMGFRTIGCFPCTTPVRPDEDDRAGRWRHLADVTYCGINPTDKGAEVPMVEISPLFTRLRDAM